MSRHRLFVASLIGMTGLAACMRDAPPPAEPAPAPAPANPSSTAPAVVYPCASGQSVSIRYPDAGSAEVIYQGRTHAMRAVPSASGARYTGDGLEWRTETREGAETGVLGRLDADPNLGVDEIERCIRPSSNPDLPAPGAPTAPQPAPGGVLPASTPCRVAQLRLASDSGDAGAGNRVNVFSVTNTGDAACSVAGYPSVGLLDAQGRGLTTVRSDQNPAVAAPVSIPAGGKAYFDIAWNVVPNEGNGERVCPSAARVRVLIPGDTAALAIPLTFTPCGGRIRVNPFRAGVEPAAPPEPAASAA